MLRLVPIVGTLSFARDRDTELNVSLIKVQNNDTCSESGFSCDFSEVNAAGEPMGPRKGKMPTLEIGTLEQPIPAGSRNGEKVTPALVCCSAQMDLQGAPMNHTWVKLGANVTPGATTVSLEEPVTGHR